MFEVWQNLAPFGGRPIGSTVEALLTKVVNRQSSVSPVVVFFVAAAVSIITRPNGAESIIISVPPAESMILSAPPTESMILSAHECALRVSYSQHGLALRVCHSQHGILTYSNTLSMMH